LTLLTKQPSSYYLFFNPTGYRPVTKPLCLMPKFIMKDGKFVAKEEQITVNAISGTLAGVRVFVPEQGKPKLQLDLKDGENVNTLSLRLYADPALNILRCLYGIAEIIADKVLTISLEEREGHDSFIHVSADGEELPRCGEVEAYAYDRKLFTDKCYGVLKRCFDFKKAVLVYANADGIYPATCEDVQAVVDYIHEMRRLGRSGELTVKKTVFTNPGAAKGYLKALRDLGTVRGFRVFYDEEAIEAIWTAYTDELPADSSASSAAGDPNDEEEV